MYLFIINDIYCFLYLHTHKHTHIHIYIILVSFYIFKYFIIYFYYILLLFYCYIHDDFLVLRDIFNCIVLLFFMRQNTNELYRIVKYLFIFIHFVFINFVLILSLPRAGWYIDKFNRTSIPYLQVCIKNPWVFDLGHQLNLILLLLLLLYINIFIHNSLIISLF